MWSRKWRESWKRDREVKLAAVQKKALSKSKEKSQISRLLLLVLL